MNDNYNYVEKEEKNFPWARMFLGLTSVVLVIVIFLLFLRFCGKKSLSDDLLKAGKKYYTDSSSLLPAEVGQCTTVNIEELENNKLINNSKYKTCDKQNTYVKVCYLESKNYHYTAILSCDVETSSFDLWKDGSEKDLITDKSDVRFKFKGQELTLETKKYFPADKTNAGEVTEYYLTSPDSNYTLKEDEQTGYKWYTNKSQNTYYNKGQYSSTQPNGFPNKGESKVTTNYSLTKPNSATYRTIESATLYRQKTVARQYKWECYSTDSRLSGTMQLSTTPCALRDDTYTEFRNVAHYTCDGTKKVDVGTVCADLTDWSTESCKTSAVTGVQCETQSGYIYKDTMWKWYKQDNIKSYYPSLSTNADEEKTYYVNAPVTDAIKDESTKNQVFKFYKSEKDTTSGNVEQWNDITNGFVTEEELIKAFNSKGYEVKSLSDINKLEKIRYEYQLQYRNLNK